ncbi:MAG: 4'-phosphopantetheinyl transferase superfamily protein [Actinobacteria bacterium]|nr:4'-phosphopantetheinyl transferase superfamily protein [Actinomycetota bacterium]
MARPSFPADALRALAVSEPGAPRLALIDARLSGLDETELRESARALAERSGAAHEARSYRHPYAVVAWHPEPLGVDIERIEPCEPGFAEAICTQRERAAAAALAGDKRDSFLISLWSSKEALSKALGDALDYDPRRLEGPLGWPQGRSGRWRAEQLELPSGYVGWVCWRAEKAAAS